jgi:NAD(P)-dependent dehydrogenase (short-subunit alcohol dehydrogenase family)
VIVDFSLDGKVAIVTGAAVGGIGEAYATALAQAGAAVTCADINEAGAKGVADAITAAGGTAVAAGVDITDDASVGAMVARTVDELGGVDILVNNAALMAQIAAYPPLEFPPELWRQSFDVNVTGAWNCARAVVPEMVKRGGGRIVNQASIGAFPAESVYGITKIAMIGLTTTLARTLGPSNISVNCIAPGVTGSVAGKSLTPDGSPYVEMIKQRAALRALGEPSDLCGALLLFTSPAGSWITGQVLVVDGGVVLHT